MSNATVLYLGDARDTDFEYMPKCSATWENNPERYSGVIKTVLWCSLVTGHPGPHMDISRGMIDAIWMETEA